MFRPLLLQHRLHPLLIVEIPTHRFANALFELVRGNPAEFLLNLARVDRVTAVVAGTVLHERDQLARIAAETRVHFVDEIADQFDDADVGPFVVAADVVSLAELAAAEDGPERFGVVADVEPVADVHAVAVNRNRLAGEDALDDDRDELLGKLIWAVVVRAIGNNGRQAVRVMIGAHEHVAAGFARGVGGVWRVRSGFGEITRRAEAAVDFVGGNVMEFFVVEFRAPESAAGFEEVEGADDVGVDEIAGAGDRAVHVRFGGEMHDVSDRVALDDFEDGGFIAEVDLFESVFRMLRNFFQVHQMTGVGEAIEVDEPLDVRIVDDVMDDV